MSDNVVPPTNPESAPNSQSGACTSGCRHRSSSGFLRAVLYTPVIIVLGGLAALATFPDLAQYASPLIDQLPKSAMNSKCAFKCQSSNPSIDLTNPVYQQTPGCCEAGNPIAKKFAAMGLGCCEDHSSCPSSAASKSDRALAMVITEDTAGELPADATQIENHVDLDAASN